MTGPPPRFRREQFRTFLYFAGFVRQWNGLGLDDEDLRELEQQILANPLAGAAVAGTGGLRKLRFSPSRLHRGKSGSFRIGYSHSPSLAKVAMIAVYSKNEKSNLSPSERNEIREILGRFWKSQG